MLEIFVKGAELFDESTSLFIHGEDCVLRLEHSLISVSKWESKWHKPFISKEPMSREELEDYIRCMTIMQNVDPMVYKLLSEDNIQTVKAYIENPMTATWFNEKKRPGGSSRAITSELVYCWMVKMQIPFDPCEKWHLNRLLTLIRVCDAENAPKKRMRKGDIFKQNAALNELRRQQTGSHG